MKSGEVQITREWLLARCEREEKSSRHLLWKLACGNGGPRGHARTADGREAQFSVRHAAYRMWNDGVEIPPGQVVRPTCGDPLCLAKGCLKAAVHGGYNRGKPRSPATKQKIAQTNRLRCGTPPELVEAVKMDCRPLDEVVAAHNLPRRTVQDIRSGRRWADFTGPIGAMVAALSQGGT